jgi:hypothetical protein
MPKKEVNFAYLLYFISFFWALFLFIYSKFIFGDIW